MFNLNDVYGCLHFDEKNLSFLVIEYKNGIPYYLHSFVEEADNNEAVGLADKQIEKKVDDLIQKSEKKLNLKFTNLAISLDTKLVSDIKIKEIKLEKITFTSVSEVVKLSRTKLKNYMKNGYFRNYVFSDLKLAKVTNSRHEEVSLNNVKQGSVIDLTWHLTYVTCKDLVRVIDVLDRSSIGVLNVSIVKNNLPSLIENGNNTYSYIAVIRKSKSDIYLVREGQIIKQKELKYCTDNLVQYIKNQYSSKNIEFDEKNKVYRTLKQSIMIHKYGVSNATILCETTDRFLSYKSVSTNDIYNFCQDYTKELFNEVNVFIDEMKKSYKIKKNNVFFVFSDDFYQHVVASVVTKLQSAETKYHIINYNLVVNTDQRLIFPFAAILNLINKQKRLGFYECSIDPYYDKDYELMAIKKNTRLKLEKTMNGIIQKLVK